MANLTLPLRNIGSAGVNTDRLPVQLEQPQWSGCNNVRFESGAVIRAPHFRKIGTASAGSPSFVYGSAYPSGGSEFLIGLSDGRVIRGQARGRNAEPWIETDLTPLEWSPHVFEAQPTTACELQGRIYWNRPDRGLWSMRKGDQGFTAVEGWDRETTCRAVRRLGDQIIALNVTQGGQTIPAMVKWSDFVPFEAAKLDFGTATTNSAGDNILGSLTGQIVDGAELGVRMFVYSNRQVYAMTPQPTNFIFDFEERFRDRGVISQNCIGMANNQHMVFGPDNIWCHDGTSVLWTTNDSVQRGIYDHLVREAAHRFYVLHLPARREMMFCFVSTHPDCKFPIGREYTPNDLGDYPGCNRAAVFNYGNGLWSFSDLPYNTGGAVVQPSTGVRWEQLAGKTWNDLRAEKTTWLDFRDRNPEIAVMVSPVRAYTPPAVTRAEATDDTFAMRRRAR